MKLLGVILAGGQSQRMGQDKLFIELGGEMLITRTVERLRAQIEEVVINGPAEKTFLSAQDVPLVPDRIKGFQGPLAGIHAGLAYAREHGFGGIITAAADTPFFPLDYVSRMMGEEVAIARTTDGLHPVFALWPDRAKEVIETLLAAETRKVMAAAEALGWRAVDFEVAGLDPFFNINTPQDLERAEQELAS